VPGELHAAVLAALVRLLVAPPPASMAPNWPAAAEAAVAALYALSPQPQELMAAVLQELFVRCTPGGGGACAAPGAGGAAPQSACEPQVLGHSAAALSRLFFVLGRTSVQHLLHVEQLGKAIRAARLAASRAAAEACEKARDAAAAAAAAAAASAKPGRRGASSKAAAAAADAAAQAAQRQQDDIGSMLGAGALAADAELDDLCDRVEAQVRVYV
jgi:hypothetical protein